MILMRLWVLSKLNLSFFIFRWWQSLSGRLVALTMIFFAFGASLAIIIPLNDYRMTWLETRIATAHVASLSLSEKSTQKITPSLGAILFKNSSLLSIAMISYGDQSQTQDKIYNLTISAQPSLPIAKIIDFQKETLLTQLSRTAEILISGGGDTVKIIGETKTNPMRHIEILINDSALYEEMMNHGYLILNRGIIMALIISMFLFAAAHYLFVRPLQRLSRNMSSFQKNPEDAANIIIPNKGTDEICKAERALANMQEGFRQALHQKTRMAELGQAVNKINHDLRNILSSAQLMADRLVESRDPNSISAAPRIVSSLNRAIDLCTRTLEYGRAEGRSPKPCKILLRRLVEDVADAVNVPHSVSHSVSHNAPHDGAIQWINEMPADLHIWADYEYVFRIMLNLGRNAIQAIQESEKEPSSLKQVYITAECFDGMAHIDVRDTGPGLSMRARANLFLPFAGSTKTGGKDKDTGFGLGLPIARELARVSGGDLILIETGAQGTIFRLTVPAERMRQK